MPRVGKQDVPVQAQTDSQPPETAPVAAPHAAAAAPVAQLAVPRREAVPDLSSLPHAVADYFGSKGYSVTLASMHQTAVMQMSVDQRFPLCLEDVADETARQEMKQALTRTGFQIKEGFPQRGDCYIYIQPVEAREAQLRRGLAVWLHQDDPASVDSTITEINDLFVGSNLTNSHATASDIGRLSDHVGAWRD